MSKQLTMMKTKFRFPAMSQMDKTEAWLSKMEADGWRLDDAKFPFVYYFKRSTSRNAKYFFTQYSKTLQLQNMASELQEQGWIKEYSNGTSLAVYRKPDREEEPAQVPKKYLQQRCELLKKRAVNNAIFCFIIALAALAFLFFDPNIWVSIIFLAATLLLGGYYIYGYFYLCKKLDELKGTKDDQKQLNA